MSGMGELGSYAEALGVQVTKVDGDVVLTLPFGETATGRTGFFHGGVIGSLLEMACLEAWKDRPDRPDGLPRCLNLAIDFLRGAEAEAGQLHAAARIGRRGRRVTYMEAEAWQTDRARLVAKARVHVVSGTAT
jgi:uncharacterized protein (TIGR00369 family)